MPLFNLKKKTEILFLNKCERLGFLKINVFKKNSHLCVAYQVVKKMIKTVSDHHHLGTPLRLFKPLNIHSGVYYYLRKNIKIDTVMNLLLPTLWSHLTQFIPHLLHKLDYSTIVRFILFHRFCNPIPESLLHCLFNFCLPVKKSQSTAQARMHKCKYAQLIFFQTTLVTNNTIK